jgi:hypothetical protein
VYAVAVHLNYLFLVYVAVLGLSAWGTGVLFAGLWLSELVPALLMGKVPASLTDAGLWVNPIHVIDLSMVLPGFIVSGIAALKGREHGLFWLAPWLVFSVLMGSSIIAAMVLMMGAGAANTVPATVMVSVVVAASLLALRGYLRLPAPARSDGS